MMTLQRISKMILTLVLAWRKQPPKHTKILVVATDAWEVTKDVKFTSGIMTIDVNGGTAGERYILKQDSNIIFDTGNNWDTRGNAKSYDFDRFIVEYSPGKRYNLRVRSLVRW